MALPLTLLLRVVPLLRVMLPVFARSSKDLEPAVMLRVVMLPP